MVIDPRRRARQLAKKAAKRKAQLAERRRFDQRSGAFWNGMLASRIAAMPVRECLVNEQLFDIGLGSVIISRAAGAQVAVSVFLVDTGCLGVKSAFLRILSEGEYRGMVTSISERESLIPIAPERARKLVEEAVEYARNLGFGPDKDYRQARAIFGTIDPSLCGETFQFGRDGKPLYVSGPGESATRRRQIVDTLTTRCGKDGFHYIVGIGDEQSDDDDEEMEESDWED